MELVSKKEFHRLMHRNHSGNEIFTDVIFQMMRMPRINEFYSEHYEKSPIEFIDAIIDDLGIKYNISPPDLERIPRTGPFVVIANHPYGALDGILMYKIISEVRPDFKVMANFILQRIEPLKECFFPVNPFETKKGLKTNIKGIRSSIEHVLSHHPLGIFPAGEVSTFNFSENRIADKEWEDGIVRFVIKSGSPIVPLFISGTNSLMFHALGRIHPLFRTASLPSELINKKDKTIHIRIGNPIVQTELKSLETVKEKGRYLRARIYSLGNSLDINKFYKKPLKGIKKIQEPVIDGIDKNILFKEIENIKAEALLFEMNHFSVFCTTTDKIPNLIIEIGRLREITFREVNEGTNKCIDLDQYDVYYHHLIIWDNKVERVVGSYRIGKGKDIIEEFGIKGFYIRSLFKVNAGLKEILEHSLELGRSFIVKDYQKKALPLFLLWKGIFCFLLKNKEYRYLIGPVSISNSFSKFSKSLIVSFVQSNYYNKELAKFVKPRKKFRIPNKHMPEIRCLVTESSNVNGMDNLVNDIENDLKIPVLLKKYLSLNAKIIGFNVDPLFNNCLDGLIVLDYLDVPKNMINLLTKEYKNTISF